LKGLEAERHEKRLQVIFELMYNLQVMKTELSSEMQSSNRSRVLNALRALLERPGGWNEVGPERHERRHEVIFEGRANVQFTSHEDKAVIKDAKYKCKYSRIEGRVSENADVN